MNLKEVKELLDKNNITYQLIQYNDEMDFWKHIIAFPSNTRGCKEKIIVIVIESNNGKKNIEIQFEETPDGFEFVDLYFGGFDFELFDTKDEYLSDELISLITEIMECKVGFIELVDLKNKRWCADASYEYEDEESMLDYQRALQKIEKPRSFFDRIKKSKLQYEIYDWNTYRCIVKE